MSKRKARLVLHPSKELNLLDVILRSFAARLGTLVREYKFHPQRRWRLDFAIPEKKIAFEYEGGVWTHGRHVRGKGYTSDCEKYNAATLLGWKVYRITPNMIRSGYLVSLLESIAVAANE